MERKPEAKGQHYVHRAYLQGFVDPDTNDEFLWLYMPKKHPYKQRPERIAKRNYFYCHLNEEKRSFDTEHILQRLEDAALPLLRKLNQRDFSLSDDERITFAGYVALAHTRVPTFQKFIDETTSWFTAKQLEFLIRSDNSILERYAKKLSEEKGEEISVEGLKREMSAGSVTLDQTNRGWSLRHMFRAMLTIQEVVYRIHWTFLIAPDDDPGFLTSDNPISLYDPAAGFGTGFESSPQAYFTFALSKSLCLLARHYKAQSVANATSREVRRINKGTVGRADTQIYAPFNSMKIQEMLNEVVGRRRGSGKIYLRHGRAVRE